MIDLTEHNQHELQYNDDSYSYIRLSVQSYISSKSKGSHLRIVHVMLEHACSRNCLSPRVTQTAQLHQSSNEGFQMGKAYIRAPTKHLENVMDSVPIAIATYIYVAIFMIS